MGQVIDMKVWKRNKLAGFEIEEMPKLYVDKSKGIVSGKPFNERLQQVKKDANRITDLINNIKELNNAKPK